MENNTFEYFDDVNDLANGKQIILAADSSTSYTSKENCFSIRKITSADGAAVEDWLLQVDEERYVYALGMMN